MKIPATIRRKLADFLEYMLWVISERQVVHAVYKKRRHVPRRARSKRHGSTTAGDISRWEQGVLTKELGDQLFGEEFRVNWFSAPFKYAITKFRPSFMKTFKADLLQMLRHCISEGYIEIVPNSYPERLRDTVNGRKLLSIWYYPRMLIEYEPVRDLLKEVIKWSVIAFLGYVGITQTVSAIIQQ